MRRKLCSVGMLLSEAAAFPTSQLYAVVLKTEHKISLHLQVGVYTS